MDLQIRADGTSFEQSTYYQAYLLDMFSLHAMLARPGPEYLAKLERMAEFLHAVIGPSRLPPMLGDDDGGRLPLGPARCGAQGREVGVPALSRCRNRCDDLRDDTRRCGCRSLRCAALGPQPFRHVEHRGSLWRPKRY